MNWYTLINPNTYTKPVFTTVVNITEAAGLKFVKFLPVFRNYANGESIGILFNEFLDNLKGEENGR